jgi:hypothetical protein
MTLTSRTVIALVIVLATLGCHGSSVPSSPSGALCARLASLCASDASANELTQCERDVASGSAGLDAENVVRTARCVAEARSCGEATGCMAGAALRSGTTFLRDFTYGLTR